MRKTHRQVQEDLSMLMQCFDLKVSQLREEIDKGVKEGLQQASQSCKVSQAEIKTFVKEWRPWRKRATAQVDHLKSVTEITL